MKKFKIQFLAVGLAFLTAGTLLTFNACKKDPCKDNTCNGHGTPTASGDVCNCACTTGYEGTKCETEVRTKFLGTYTVGGTVACGVSGNSTTTGNPMVVSTSSTAVNKIVIALAGYNLAASVSGTSLTLDSQSGSGGTTITGSGSISGTNISLTMNEYDPTVLETCVYTLTGPKQ